MKKSTRVALVGVFLVAALVGVNAQAKKVTLTMWGTSNASEFDVANGKAFEKANPDIGFKNVIVADDPGNAYFEGIAKGNAPDLLQVSFAKFDQYVRAGILQDLSGYTKNWPDLKNFDSTLMGTFSRNGKLYAVPARVYPMTFAYNEELFKKAGLTSPPKNWDEVLAYAAKLTDKSKNVAGLGILTGQWTEWWFQYYVWQAGGDLTKKNADGTISLTFTDPAVTAAAKFYQTAIKAGVVQSDITMPFPAMVSAFAAGKIAMMPFAVDWVNWAVGEGMKRENIALMPFPEGPGKSQAAAVSGTVWVINPKSTQAQKDAAVRYLKYMTSKDYYTTMFKEMEKRGAVNPEPMVRTDLPLTSIVNVKASWMDAMKRVVAVNKPEEFYGKGDFGKYVDGAVQQVITNVNADPAPFFAAAQKQAVDEGAVDKFNKR